jgi:alpha-D-ribose 1-methylphosphonate 5-triphosphate synthase subunit PhnG
LLIGYLLGDVPSQNRNGTETNLYDITGENRNDTHCMLQSFDNDIADATTRARWMRVLARASVDALEAGLAKYSSAPRHWLRRPETGLFMLRGRIGGNGAKFNVGEVTVTRCVLRVRASIDSTAEYVGVAYVMGRPHRHAELAAMADALLQDAAVHAVLYRDLVAPLERAETERAAAQERKAQATRVEFFTVAREAKQAA